MFFLKSQTSDITLNSSLQILYCKSYTICITNAYGYETGVRNKQTIKTTNLSLLHMTLDQLKQHSHQHTYSYLPHSEHLLLYIPFEWMNAYVYLLKDSNISSKVSYIHCVLFTVNICKSGVVFIVSGKHFRTSF